MSSYPTAAKTFTTKGAGDTIQPAHVNDLQDEVAAIEAGLLNGTAPLNSSNSTLANLVVSGVSTFAGDVKINSTLTVTKIISTSIGVAGVTSYVRVYAGSPAQVSSASTGTKMACDQEVADLLGEYDSTTYTFTPQSSGYYLINARAQSITNGPLTLYSQLWVNDTVQVNVGAIHQNGEFWDSPVISATLNLSSGSAGALQWRIYTTSTSRFSSGLAFTGMEIIKLF